MESEALGSWTIILTFVITFTYLLKEQPEFAPLALAAKFSTAMLLCFVGLLFTAGVSYLSQQMQTPLSSPLLLALLVPIGTLLAGLIRYRWRRQMNQSR